MISGGFSRGNPPAHWHSIDTLNDGPLAPQALPGVAAVWPSANLAIYTPVVVRSLVVVKKLWFGAGATGTGNYDIGLYDASGVALLRKGPAAKGTTIEEVVWDCTDTTISPGIYYLALSCSNNTDTFQATEPAAPIATACGLLTEASAGTLPATATFAILQTLATVPIMGMFLDTRVS